MEFSLLTSILLALLVLVSLAEVRASPMPPTDTFDFFLDLNSRGKLALLRRVLENEEFYNLSPSELQALKEDVYTRLEERNDIMAEILAESRWVDGDGDGD
ncbi:uncharacterized protein VTP21DRAFT_2862 [Calcarisporiella thermophila]|uniref:uncharacterized protein n=1 Tax=Calcarisporiella thermophila TaxID=911321 RepID=UPI003742F766